MDYNLELMIEPRFPFYPKCFSSRVFFHSNKVKPEHMANRLSGRVLSSESRLQSLTPNTSMMKVLG